MRRLTILAATAALASLGAATSVATVASGSLCADVNVNGDSVVSECVDLPETALAGGSLCYDISIAGTPVEASDCHDLPA